MMVIKSGEWNYIHFSCMYDPHGNIADYEKEVDGETLYGVEGIADSLNDAASILWFDKDMNFVEAEIMKKCVNCEDCGKSGGGFFAECLNRGFQINNEYEECCDEFKMNFNKERN